MVSRQSGGWRLALLVAVTIVLVAVGGFAVAESTRQETALADGVVTEAEYRAVMAEALDCMNQTPQVDAWFEEDGSGKYLDLEIRVPSADMDDIVIEAMDRCFDTYATEVEYAWLDANEITAADLPEVIADVYVCLAAKDVELAPERVGSDPSNLRSSSPAEASAALDAVFDVDHEDELKVHDCLDRAGMRAYTGR